MVKTIASKYGLEVEVIDVTRENFLGILIRRRRGKIDIFPTLIAGSGQKAEGEITEKQVESLLSQMAREKKYAELNGFKNTLIKSEENIHLDGSADSLLTVNIVATRDGFSSRAHLHQSGIGTTLDQLRHDFRVTKSASRHNVDASARPSVDPVTVA
jgi:hypothetical protein